MKKLFYLSLVSFLLILGVLAQPQFFPGTIPSPQGPGMAQPIGASTYLAAGANIAISTNGNLFTISANAVASAGSYTNLITVSSKGIINGASGTANNGAMFGPDTSGTVTSGLQEAWNYGENIITSNGPVARGFTLKLDDGYYFYTNKLRFWQTNVSSARIIGDNMLSTKLVYAGNNDYFVDGSCILFTNSVIDDTGFSIAGHLFVENLGFSAVNDTKANVLLEVRNLGGSFFEHLNFTGWQIMTNRLHGDGASLSIADVPVLYPPGLVGLWLNTGGGDHGNYIGDIYLADLADGLILFCDHAFVTGLKTAWLGGIGVAGGTNIWPTTNIFNLGAGVIDAINLDASLGYAHFYRTRVGIAKYSGYAPDGTPNGGATVFDHVNYENTSYPIISDGGNNCRVILRDPADDSITLTNIQAFYYSSPASGNPTYASNIFSILTSIYFNDVVIRGSGASLRSHKDWYVIHGTNYVLDLATNLNFTINSPNVTNNASFQYNKSSFTNYFGASFNFEADSTGILRYKAANETLAEMQPAAVSSSGDTEFIGVDARFAKFLGGDGSGITNLSAGNIRPFVLSNLQQTVTVFVNTLSASNSTYAAGVRISTNGNIDASGIITGNGSGITNIPTVTSDTLPPSFWYTNQLTTPSLAPLTPAATTTATTSTNTEASGWIFSDTVTNIIRSRWSLPYDWDTGVVRVGVRSYLPAGVIGTGAGSTNVVFGVRAAAIQNGIGFNEGNVTFGTLVRMTNHMVNTNGWASSESITGDLTVGNTPTSASSILWEVQRLGSDAGDLATNAVGCVVNEVRIYYKRNTQVTWPTASP